MEMQICPRGFVLLMIIDLQVEKNGDAGARDFVVKVICANSLPFYMLRPFTSHYLARA